MDLACGPWRPPGTLGRAVQERCCDDGAGGLPRSPVRTHWAHVAAEHSKCGPCDGGTEFFMLFNFNINFNDLILSHPVWLAAASLASTDLKRHCLCSGKHIQKHPLTALFTSSKKMTSRCIHTMENEYRNGEHLPSAVFMPRSDTIPVSAHWVPTVRHRENDCTIAA